MPSTEMISVEGLSKTFKLHLMGGTELPVIEAAALSVRAGECVVLGGPSGVGKSSILKMIYGNYRADQGSIVVQGESGPLDVVTATPRQILRLRASTLGYVSQFLKVIPRISTFDIVRSEMKQTDDVAHARTRDLLIRLSLPEQLWSLPPATFSGGEQQRVNIARGFAADHSILLLDEPTASLDRHNRDAVIALIREKKAAGVGILAIFHDEEVRESLADRIVDVKQFAPSLAGHRPLNF